MNFVSVTRISSKSFYFVSEPSYKYLVLTINQSIDTFFCELNIFKEIFPPKTSFFLRNFLEKISFLFDKFQQWGYNACGGGGSQELPLFLIDVGGGVLCLGEFFVQRNYHCFNWFWEWGTMMGGGMFKEIAIVFHRFWWWVTICMGVFEPKIFSWGIRQVLILQMLFHLLSAYKIQKLREICLSKEIR